ncbi:helix-turn-helix domain-containing protein [Paenibacillus silviterrae]|uniref:helix-turn-helix domain-containing protein n=1 Tax=Paenibacillus silviterrae TaxID=3242194 RepID=UPI002542E5D7|nr:AraC family transcriptional regulator [Paenibacillus chinjuensis]
MIQLISCGYNFIHPNGITIDRPNGSGDYAFVFFRSRCEIVVDDNAMRPDKYSYILFSPYRRHLYREVDKPFVNDWFHCSGDDVHELVSRLHFPLDKPVQARDPFQISRSIMELQSTLRLGGPLRDSIIDSEVRTLFMKLCNVNEKKPLPEKTNQYFLLFSELRNELYSSPGNQVSVEKLASSVNLSKSYFQHIYKELFGCSVISDMINARLEYAQYLLNNSSLSVAAIAKMCGYENDTHFMRQFKKFIGVSPGKYKNNKS